MVTTFLHRKHWFLCGLFISVILQLGCTAAPPVALKETSPEEVSGKAMIQKEKSSDSKNSSGLAWKSGAFGRTEGFPEWRGRPLDFTLQFFGELAWKGGYEKWLENSAINAGLTRAINSGYGIAIAVPLLNNADRQNFKKVASGGLDAMHLAIAKRIKLNAKDHLVHIRLGHEANRGRYPWHFDDQKGRADPVVYKAAWRRIALIYRNELGPDVRMVWNHVWDHQTVRNYSLESFYPGDDVVDVLGLDMYDNCGQGICVDSEENWQKLLGRHEVTTGKAWGLQGILDFAKYHGKKFSVDEWAPMNSGKSKNASHGSNNSFFVRKMFEFFTTNAESMEFEVYFNYGEQHQIWPPAPWLMNASNAYKSAWTP